MKSEIITVNGIAFASKQLLLNRLKQMLNKAAINESDNLFLCDLVKRHPNAKAKIGNGIAYVAIEPINDKQRCFFIHRKDGSKVHFSYFACVNNVLCNNPLTLFKKAARLAVKDQTRQYFLRYTNSHRLKNNSVICEKTGYPIELEKACVDHIPPMTFNRIVTDFIESQNIEVASIEYKEFQVGFSQCFKDLILAENFANYHERVAQLRVISIDENLKQKRK